MASAAACRRPAAAAVAVGALLLLLAAQGQALSAVSLVEEVKTREQLLAFKASFANGDQVLSYWNASTSYCTWQKEGSDPKVKQGVTCGPDGQVTDM